MDKWYGLTMDDIRRYEEETKAELDRVGMVGIRKGWNGIYSSGNGFPLICSEFVVAFAATAFWRNFLATCHREGGQIYPQPLRSDART